MAIWALCVVFSCSVGCSRDFTGENVDATDAVCACKTAACARKHSATLQELRDAHMAAGEPDLAVFDIVSLRANECLCRQMIDHLLDVTIGELRTKLGPKMADQLAAKLNDAEAVAGSVRRCMYADLSETLCMISVESVDDAEGCRKSVEPLKDPDKP